MTKVINLYGGPGTGKSTTAAHLFALMKQDGKNVELVTEYAKDKVWENSLGVLGNQVYILGKQYHRMFRLLNKTEYIITDSPLLFSLYYGASHGNSFKELVLDLYRSMDNINVFLIREKPYVALGRMQTEPEARAIDGELAKLLAHHRIYHHNVKADTNAAKTIKDLLQ